MSIKMTCWLDGKRRIFYGNNSGEMRASIYAYYGDRQPDRIIPKVLLCK